ncbi:MAG: 7TM diverse intracellular signaling domain-containing protein [Turneriella sp.]
MRIFFPVVFFNLLLLCLLSGTSIGAADESASLNLDQTHILGLDQIPWQFYWQKFLTTDDLRQHKHSPDLILIPPSIWNGQIVRGVRLSSFGYATYAAKFHAGVTGQRLALRLPPPLTSYRIFINGELVSEVGQPASSEEHYIPRRKSALIYFTPTENEIEIIIHVANYLTYKGGLRSKIELGRAEQMQSFGMRYLAIDLFSIGLIFAIMLYHLLIFVLTRRYLPTLIFAILALDYFLLAFFFGEQSIALFFPEFPLPVHVRVASFFTYVLPPLVLEFTGRLYPGTVNSKILRLYWVVAFAFILMLILPPIYFMRMNIYYYGVVAFSAGLVCLWGVFQAVRQKQPGARILLVGLLFLVALTLYAAFLYFTHSVAGSFLSIGFTLFALFQSGSLAHTHAALDRENILMQERLERSRNALENQRKQIEANLHDSLGGNLTDIKLGLEALEKQPAARSIADDIRRLDHQVSGTIASLRTELLFLEDMQLAMKDFVSGINLILLRRYQMAKRPVEIEISSETRERGKLLQKSGVLSDERIPELCMVVQELCNNSLKYAAGTTHWKIEADASHLRISVQAKSRSKKITGGFGRDTLRHRTEKLQASFSHSVENGTYRAFVELL